MKKNLRKALFSLTISSLVATGTSDARAETLSTTVADNNRQSYNIFDIKALKAITINGINQRFKDDGVSYTNYKVYYREGSAVGLNSQSTGWILFGTSSNGTTDDSGDHTSITFDSTPNLELSAESTYGLMVGGQTETYNGYTNGNAVGDVAAEDENLIIYEGYGATLTNTRTFSPRIWNGGIVYIPPFTVAMAKPFAILKSNNVQIANSYVNNSLLNSQQYCESHGLKVFNGKGCVHANYFHANRYTFGDSNNNSYQAHQTAGNYGFDYQLSEPLSIGLRYSSGTSGMDNDTNTTGIASQATIHSNHWGLKATYEGGEDTFISGYLGFTDFDNHLDRQNNSGTTSTKSKYDSDAYSAGIKISKLVVLNSNFTLIPDLSATYTTYEQPQINETGTGDLLTINRSDSQSLLMRIGAKALKSLKVNNDKYNANIYFGAWYEFDPYSTRSGEREVSAKIASSSASAVSSPSQPVKSQKLNLEVGTAVDLDTRTQLSLSGGLDLAADVSNSYVRGGVSWSF